MSTGGKENGKPFSAASLLSDQSHIHDLHESISFNQLQAKKLMIERTGDDSMFPMPNIGKRIRLLRESVPGRTQEEFANLLGVKRGAVGNWELGGGTKRENLIRISQIAGAPLDWLLGEAGDDDVLPSMTQAPPPPPPPTAALGARNILMVAIDETLRATGVRIEFAPALAAMILQVVVANPPEIEGMTQEELTRMIVRRRVEQILASPPLGK